MAHRSLSEMASAVAFKHIKSILSVGFLSYASVRHILLKVDDARQLRSIELNCPQLQGETGELWIKLIESDFPLEAKAKQLVASGPDTWHEVWEQYKVAHDRSLQESEEKLRAAFMGLQQDKEKKVSKIVEGRFLPSDAKRPKKRLPKDNTTSVLSFGGGSRTKTLTGAGVMRKARREAKEVRSIQGALSRSIVAPIRVLEKKHLKAPPPAMVQERRIAAQPAFRTPEAEKQREQLQQRTLLPAPAFASGSGSSSGAAFASGSGSAPAPATHPAASARKLSMFQRKFAGGKGKGIAKSSPPKPLTINTTTTAAMMKSIESRSGTPSPSAAMDGRHQQRPSTPTMPASPLPESPNTREEIAKSLSPPVPVLPPRKKKPVNIFMKRPVRRT